MKVLSVQEIAVLAKEVVREVGPEYFDREYDNAYVYANGKNCLVGAILKKGGVDLEPLFGEMENECAVSALLSVKNNESYMGSHLPVELDSEAAMNLLSYLQMGNDSEQIWEELLSDAVEAVERNFKIKLNLTEYCEVADEVEQMIQEELAREEVLV